MADALTKDPRAKEAYVDSFLATLRETLLSAHSIEISTERGVARRDNHASGVVEYAPIPAGTITIRVNGGTREMVAPPVWSE